MVNHRYSNSVASGKTPVSDVKCDFGVVHLKYDRLLELQLLEMFETPAATSGSKKFEDHSAKPHAFNIEINCPRLSSDLRFQALEVANIRKELRPDALTVSVTFFLCLALETARITLFLVYFCSLSSAL